MTNHTHVLPSNSKAENRLKIMTQTATHDVMINMQSINMETTVYYILSMQKVSGESSGKSWTKKVERDAGFPVEGDVKYASQRGTTKAADMT